MKSRYRKTRKTYDTPGDAHFVTFSTFQRKPLFTKERCCRWMIDAIDLARSRNPFELWAWVIMPEHVHILIYPEAETTIASVLKSMKQSISKRAIVWLKTNAPEFLSELEDVQPNGQRSFRFWQRGGGYDRNLRSVRDIHEKIVYIHQNPVTRGLVSNPCEYKWSSAKAWESEVDDPISLDRGSVPELTILDDYVDSKLMH